MRKVTIAALLVLVAVVGASAEEIASYWSRQILVGYTNDAYYCLAYESVQHGSNTVYYERVFWRKFSKAGISLEMKLVREVKHTFSEFENAWVTTETVDAPLNVISMLIQSGATIAFPMNAGEGAFYLDDDGIQYDNGYQTSLAVSDGQIAELIKDYREWPDYEDYKKDTFKLVGHYSSSKTIYFVLQFGGPGHEQMMRCYQEKKCIDNMPVKLAYQVIIPVPLSEMPRLRTLVIHKVKKGQSLSRIAKKYDVTLKEIMTWNKIKDKNHIFIGQKLKIYK